jgi:hypothetical protein
MCTASDRMDRANEKTRVSKDIPSGWGVTGIRRLQQITEHRSQD